MDLDLINQISKLLNSEGDLTSNINAVLITLQEYLPVRNPFLLIRDNITDKYFIELAPELSEREKNRWNRRAADMSDASRLQLQHEMTLYHGEPDLLRLPSPSASDYERAADIIQPVAYQRRHLPLGIVHATATKPEYINRTEKIIRFLSDMLAVAMIAGGFPSSRIHDSFSRESYIPKVIDNIVGKSEKLRRLADTIRKISPSKANILIRGESGTGKELVARAIHKNSLRGKAPFIGVNCNALSESLLESELFGHEKGAFTGAVGRRKGRFELADGGTLFLDEIGDTSLRFQTKILRVLQEGEFERLGGNKSIQVDTRIISATNADLEQAVENGSFREDLYYRLNVVALSVPPLRRRREDIPSLLNYFLEKFNKQSGKYLQIRSQDEHSLLEYDWPGNVRELENAVHSAFLMAQDNYLDFSGKALFPASPSKSRPKKYPATVKQEIAPGDIVKREEKTAIEKALGQTRGNASRAAKLLGVTPRQLRYRIKKYNIIVRKIGNI